MIAATVLGALAGVFTGLIPGIHVNTVAALLLAASGSCAALGIEYSALIAFTCALAISHTFFDVVPGLFLGVPGDETFALLPGHRLVKKGEGQTALRLSVIGSVIGLALGGFVIYYGPLRRSLGSLEGWVRPWMFLLLALVAAVLILSERRKLWSLFTFLLAGLLGIAVFGSPLVAGGAEAPVNVLFPSLAGMFGVAGLLFAIATVGANARPPPPERAPKLPWLRMAGPGAWGGAAGLLVGFLPGLGAANAATCLLLVARWRARLLKRWQGWRSGSETDSTDDPADQPTRAAADRAYLVTTSSLNTSEALFAIAALYIIGRSRSGASIAAEQVLGGTVLLADLRSMGTSMLFAGAIAAVVLWRAGPRLAAWFRRVDPLGLNWGVVAFLTVLTYFLLGVGGLVVLVGAAAVGLVPLVFGVRRSQLMGFFLVPATLFYSGRQAEVVEMFSLHARTAPLFPSVTVVGILLGVGTAGALATGLYFLVRSANARVGRGSRQGGRWRGLVRGGGFVVVGLILALAVTGRAYPPTPQIEEMSQSLPERMPGRVSNVIDGDTFEVLGACRRYRVRLAGIDAPETGTPGGRLAREWAEARFAGADVDWQAVGSGRYGRPIGNVYLRDGTFANEEIVGQGYATANRRYPGEHHERFLQLEGRARAAGLGVWAVQGRTPGTGEGPAAEAPDSPSRSERAAAPAVSLLPPEVAQWDDNENGRITCAEARRHGIAPVRRGDAAYPYMRDPNDDGIVCN